MDKHDVEGQLSGYNSTSKDSFVEKSGNQKVHNATGLK